MGCVDFLFDENISPQIAEALHHCGQKQPVKIKVRTLKQLDALALDDIVWVKRFLKDGVTAISADCSMVDDHDIAAIVASTGGIMFLLRSSVTQQRRWGLLRWYANNLPKLATHALGVQPGTTWHVNKDCEISRVPTQKLRIAKKAPKGSDATADLSAQRSPKVS